MLIDVRCLDLTKKLLEVVDNEIKSNPEKYDRLIKRLQVVLNKYKESDGIYD